MHLKQDPAIGAFAAILTQKPVIRSGNFQAYLYKAARNRAARFHAIRRRVQLFCLEDAHLMAAGGKQMRENDEERNPENE